MKNKTLQSALTKLDNIRQDLNKQVLDQAEAVMLVLVAFVMRDHLALVGAHGEAKTFLAERFSRYIPGKFYYHLLTRFTVPDEIVGHYSLAALQQDRYERRTDDKACDAQVVCLDEVFKANSPMLNALLGLMNERRVDGVDADLETLVGISNEWPRGIEHRGRHGDDESLAPLWDRFVMRLEIFQPTSDSTFEAILRNNIPEPSVDPLTAEEINALQEYSSQLHSKLSDQVIKCFHQLREDLAVAGIQVSSRRWYKASKAVAAHAVVNGRDKVTAADLKVLRHILWELPEQRDEVATIVMNAGAPESAVALQIEAAIAQLRDDVRKAETTTGRLVAREELAKQVSMSLEELAKLKDDPDTTDTTELVRVIGVLDDIRRGILEEMRTSLKL